MVWVGAVTLVAQAPPAPALLPGEGLAIAGSDGLVHSYGDASRESPMGGLATLLWMRLEGDEWVAMGVEFKCTGALDGRRCGPPKGHGRVNLGKALQVNCDSAFLIWTQISAERWLRHYGEGVSRVRFEEVFGPFAGPRLKAGNELPKLGPEWLGHGDLLRTSPAVLLAWMLDPHQEETLGLCRRSLQGFVNGMTRTQAWWVKTASAPVADAPAETCAWVVGSNEVVTVVLRLPRGSGTADGLARFRAIMGISEKK